LPGIKLFLNGVLALGVLLAPLAHSESTIALHWETDISVPAEPEARADLDLWQRVRDGFRIKESANPLIAVHEKWYAARPQHMQRVTERARRYMFHIVEEVERRSMPMEIALLPMIESAFDPKALSRSAASGIWQFIPSTGSHYGLKQDHWYDGRRDILASTHAALDYLGKLYLDFGDWELALAAYNCGEGCVARAIARNVQQGLPTNFASLSLPAETRHYVPKLLAAKKLILDPERYGIAIAPLPNQPYFAQVALPGSIDVPSAARLANMNTDEFVSLNPAHSRNLIRTDTPVSVLVPVGKAEVFESNLQNGSWDTWKPYAASRGERLEDIARKFGTTSQRIDEHNQISLKTGKLARDQTILVPHSGRAMRASPAPRTEQGTQHFHYVARGETLFGIARRYGISVTALLDANPGLPAKLGAGQTLRLPLPESADQPTAEIKLASYSSNQQPIGDYLVQPGDTLFGIAQRHRVSVADLQTLNPSLASNGQIKAGQRIVIGKR
jgi:membrane-bound lytic murein transglycosylase D